MWSRYSFILLLVVTSCQNQTPSPAVLTPASQPTPPQATSQPSGIATSLPSPALTVHSRQEEHIGTYVTIKVAAASAEGVARAMDASFAEIARLGQYLSEYRAESEINKINRAAGKQPVKVTAELFTVVTAAHRISAETEGAFDISFNALGGLWDFRSAHPKVPTPSAIQARVQLVDYTKVILDAQKQTVLLQKKGMRIGVGAIAKGYLVDRASAVLKAHGFPNHMVEAGGDLFASGRPGARRWNIGVRRADSPGLYASLEVENQGVATSGNYEKYFVKDGVRYHHILDPKTGRPARGLSSVTVAAADAMTADAYATALFVQGKKKALAAAQRRNLDVLLFDEAYQPTTTAGMAQRLTPLPER